MTVGRIGYPLHCRLRYFDPIARRAGIPEDVAALVSTFDAESVTVTVRRPHWRLRRSNS